MIYSMTGYGKGTSEKDGRTVVLEMRSVNQRFLDITVKMPRNLLAYEDGIRKSIQKKLARGKVDVFVTFTDTSSQDVEVIPDEGLMKAYVETLTKAAEDMEISNRLNSTDLLRIPDLFTVTQKEIDAEVIRSLIDEALNSALESMLAMREKEGAATVESFLRILSDIECCFAVIKERAPGVPADYKEKFTQRISELMDGENVEIDRQRLATEVAIFADKACIDEEITRFTTHLDHFKAIIGESEEPVGKKLDFLIQEMNREINTIGSKANDITITENVIAIKSEIEKLREQVQNLE